MNLIYSAASPYARIVRVALRETGLATQVTEQLVSREQLYSTDSEVIAANATGRVPTLQLDDGTVLTESKFILDYIDARTENRLLPRDGSGGWQAIARAGRAFSFVDGLTTWLRMRVQPEMLRNEVIIEREVSRANRTADAIEQDIDAYGGPVDCAQIVLGTALGLADARIAVWNWRNARPALSNWYEFISCRPSFRETCPPL